MGMNVKQWVYWTERGALWIAEYDPVTQEFSSPGVDESDKKIHLFYYKKAEPFKLAGESVENRSLDSNTKYLQVAVTGDTGNYSIATGDGYLDEISEIPEQFHEYLVDKAIQIGYEKKGAQGIQMAQYFSSKFEKGVRDGRAYAYRARTGPVKYIKPIDY
jgi:hypothetical protein